MILGIVLLLLSPLIAWLGWKCFDYALNDKPPEQVSDAEFTLKLLAVYGSFFALVTTICLFVGGLQLLLTCT